jgi:cellulose synthase/poly-beta-1,6-N-acetylglucosamine synthase-like glycosyltransferase
MPITLLKVNFTNSSKAKALNFAIDHFKTEPFDIVIILDADNITETNFLKNISNAYSSGAKAIQVHRTAKNLQTDVAVFDAITEEFNNSIFRKGHYALGLSSALIGSGMAFDFEWFSNNVNHLCTVGEDKELESLLLMQSVRIHYLNSVYVYDEKISKNEVYYSQRQRWLTAQYGSLKSNLRNIPVALRERNIDYLDKIFQWMLLPRIVLFGFSILISVLLLLIAPGFSVKWICLTLLELLVFALCIPQALFRKFIKVGWKTVPILFIMMFMNLFRIKRSKSFIHTPHGEF